MKNQTGTRTMFSLVGEQFTDYLSEECHRFQVDAEKLSRNELLPNLEFENIGFKDESINRNRPKIIYHPHSDRNLKLFKGQPPIRNFAVHHGKH